MQVEHVGAIARPGHQFGAARVGGRLDPDDIGAEIGELLDAGRARSHLSQIDDAQPFKRAAGGGSVHVDSTAAKHRRALFHEGMAPFDEIGALIGALCRGFNSRAINMPASTRNLVNRNLDRRHGERRVGGQ